MSRVPPFIVQAHETGKTLPGRQVLLPRSIPWCSHNHDQHSRSLFQQGSFDRDLFDRRLLAPITLWAAAAPEPRQDP